MRIQKGRPAAADEHPADPKRMALIFSAAMSGGGLRVCQFCGEWLGIQKGIAADQISHGACQPLCQPGIDMGWGEFLDDSDFTGGALSTSLAGGDGCCTPKPAVSSTIPESLNEAATASRPDFQLQEGKC